MRAVVSIRNIVVIGNRCNFQPRAHFSDIVKGVMDGTETTSTVTSAPETSGTPGIEVLILLRACSS